LKRKGVIGFKLYKNTIIEGGVSLFKNDKVKTTVFPSLFLKNLLAMNDKWPEND